VAAPIGIAAVFFLSHLSRWQMVGALALLGSVYMALCLLLTGTAVLTEGEKLWFKAMIPARRRTSELRPAAGA
jgi:hypothetical protein